MEDKIMSLLIFQHYEKQVAVYTDTLATSTDGKPLAFCNKSFLLPHMGVVMVTTGILQLAEIWNSRLNGPILADDIDELNKFAPHDLKVIWSALEGHYGQEIEVTGTIYHFGWSNKHERFVRYVYRSTNDFKSELYTENGLGVKPVPDSKIVAEGIDGAVELAKKIRSEQLAKPADERLYIGGELNMLLMLNDSGHPVVNQAKLIRFDGYDDDRKAILERSSTERAFNFPHIKYPAFE
jgi:hypothetical protein